MARHAVVVATVILHTMLGMVCAMPGPGPPSPRHTRVQRLQCPSCNRPFKTHRAVRIPQMAMGPLLPCASDLREPFASTWTGSGPRASGRLEEMGGQRVRLPGVSDSESDPERARSPRMMDEGGAESPLDMPEEPAGMDPVPAVGNEDRVKYTQIHTYTYRYTQ